MPDKQRKGILNYTTTIEPIRTAGEITGMLAAKGARSVNIDYQNCEPVALSFSIEALGKVFAFRLPSKADGVFKAMSKNKDIAYKYKNKDQAKRTAWRILKDWVEVQLAFLDAEQAELTEIFLPYIITETGQTLFERFSQDSAALIAAPERKQLSAGKVIEGDFTAVNE